MTEHDFGSDLQIKLDRYGQGFIDSHCHLDYLQRDGDLEGALERARRNNVTGMLTISTSIAGYDALQTLSDQEHDIWCTVGVHPHDAEGHKDLKVEDLVKRAAHPRTIGLGETGLDFFYDNSPRDLQEALFWRHIDAAKETGLPLIVHTRDADETMIRILKEAGASGKITGLIHCFSSGRALAEMALDIGFYISLSGILTFKRANDLRDIVKDVPLERLLIETDAPYLAPMPHRGKKNEPAYVTLTAEKLAEVKSVSLEDVSAVTTRNFFTLFHKAQ